MEIRRKRSDGLRRRPQHPAQDTPSNKDAAMDRRASRRVGKTRHQVRVRQDTRSLALIQIDFLERRVWREIGTVKLCQAAIQVDVIRRRSWRKSAASLPMTSSRNRSSEVRRSDAITSLNCGYRLGSLAMSGTWSTLSHCRNNSRSFERARRSPTMRSAWRMTCSRVLS